MDRTFVHPQLSLLHVILVINYLDLYVSLVKLTQPPLVVPLVPDQVSIP